jgi:hypothetical protein
MADVLNRTTKLYIQSANTPDHPVEQWIHNPDMSAVAGQPSKYWVITGDTVTLMSQAERDAVDVAELNDARNGTSERMNNVEDIIRALALVTLDDLNLHAARIVAILDAIDNNSTLATIKAAIDAIPDIPQRTGAQLKQAVRSKLGS